MHHGHLLHVQQLNNLLEVADRAVRHRVMENTLALPDVVLAPFE